MFDYKFWLFILPFSTISAIVYIVTRKKEKETYTSLEEIGLFDLIVKLGYKLLRCRRQGELKISDKLVYTAGSDSSYSLIIYPKNNKVGSKSIRLNRDHIDQYKALCGYGGHGHGVPVCYAETIFFKLLATLVASDRFCLSPLGLIHIAQTIKQHESLGRFLDKELFAEVAVVEYRKGEKGVEVDFRLRLMASRTYCVWEGLTTCLSRSHDRAARSRPLEPEDNIHQYSEDIPVADDCGVNYARLTGDWNPHHLYRWSAWLLGYKRPIAHGIWTLSRAIASLEKHSSSDSVKQEVRCTFKGPLYMPGRMRVQFEDPSYAQTTSGCRLLVSNPDTGEPHVEGVIKYIGRE
ncbi:3-hydroxyacyl-thioester dehydratase X-like [Mya arenaria]|uniref:3-hydroxyacyl-thioester dehydratase X-like n=1 Tax=Mya arenaria TaxID=6604 RepID=UPI0022E63E7E|nr:3-hydroxyacyl-thioester dehydratase X-like [Mya arenaria]